MSYNGYRFESIRDFTAVQRLASANGCETVQDFNNYLKKYYSKNC